MLRVSVSLPDVFEALIVTPNVPAVVGVPVIFPVEVSRLKPGGREPENTV